MEFVIFFIGVFCGVIATTLIKGKKKTFGTLRIDHSDPAKDIYRFDITDLDGLSKQKQIVLTVDNNANLSQK